jgi:hypothetical protein
MSHLLQAREDIPMPARKDQQPPFPEGDRKRDNPTRPEGDPDTLEGPGGRSEAKGEEDARNKTTRQGER